MLPTTATASTPPAPATAHASSSAGEPHAALFLALGYMRLRELLSCGRVCRSLREAVARDPLLWRRLAVEPALSHRVTDEALLELTDRAEGRLRSLHLLGCHRVSDAGLLRVVERNPSIAELVNRYRIVEILIVWPLKVLFQLSVPRCTGLTADGLVNVVHFLNEHKGNLSRLRLHGICKMTEHHLDVFNTLMCKSSQQQDAQALYYNHTVHEVLNTDDERPIDVDVCPLCKNVRLVFDCTRDDCRPHCRGCFFCIARCETCGGCIDSEELDGNRLACSDFLCTGCWLKLPKCRTCNRPYCERHSTLKENLSPSGQFTCQECMAFATSLESLEDGY